VSGVYSVSQVNAYIRNMFAQDFLLNRISVRGEVSNCKYHRSGHLYFTLKDEGGAIACVMFAGSRKGLAFAMKDGDRVVVSGSVDVYERDGRYQLYAREIRLEGAGLLYERYLALKAELEEMGMFAREYKQPIPAYVKTLGIVTAPTGAAVRDIQNIALRRNPFIQLILYPALVQGEGAKESIVRGIETLDRLGPDVIIVGRGGGSIEDLWAFNEECVARAIFNCRTPVISAVGHETDTTIADFVADLRAPTPSAAAELAVADIRAVLDRLASYRQRLRGGAEASLGLWKERLQARRERWSYLSPENQIREKRQRLLDLENRLQEGSARVVSDNRHRLQLLIGRLEALSPLKRLNQGFSYVEDSQGRAVTSVSQAAAGDSLAIQVADGCIYAEVTGTEERRREETDG
jgi:exodeoxyribonuclease VII large subunit